MHRRLSRHAISLIHTWHLRILKCFEFGACQLITIKESESLRDLAQFIILIENLLVRGFLDDLLALVNLVAESSLLQVVLNCQLIKDVIEILIKDLRCLLVQWRIRVRE